MEAILAGKEIDDIFATAINNVYLYSYAPKPGRSYPRERESPIGRFSERFAK